VHPVKTTRDIGCTTDAGLGRAEAIAVVAKVTKGQRGRWNLDYQPSHSTPERHVAEPAEASCGRMVNDQQVRSPAREVGASATPGSRINRPSAGASRAADKS